MQIDYYEAREELRQWLVKYTGDCSVQDGWPCGTCLMHLLTQIGLDSEAPEYGEHKQPVSRHNEVWRAILQIREANLKR